MTEYVVICSACGAENKDWYKQYDSYWFTCVDCGFENEQGKVWK